MRIASKDKLNVRSNVLVKVLVPRPLDLVLHEGALGPEIRLVCKDCLGTLSGGHGTRNVWLFSLGLEGGPRRGAPPIRPVNRELVRRSLRPPMAMGARQKSGRKVARVRFAINSRVAGRMEHARVCSFCWPRISRVMKRASSAQMKIATPGQTTTRLRGCPPGPAPSEAVALGPSRDLGSPRSGEGAVLSASRHDFQRSGGQPGRNFSDFRESCPWPLPGHNEG